MNKIRLLRDKQPYHPGGVLKGRCSVNKIHVHMHICSKRTTEREREREKRTYIGSRVGENDRLIQ